MSLKLAQKLAMEREKQYLILMMINIYGHNAVKISLLGVV